MTDTAPIPSPARLVAAAGEALYGPRWQQPLARLLGLSLDAKGHNRTIQRIAQAARDNDPGQRVAPEMLRVLQHALLERSGRCAAAAKAIADFAP